MGKPAPQAPVINLISLGCAKNTVDSERVLAQLAQAGFLVAEDLADADLCLVNTCGFIEDARRETAEILAALRKHRRRGRLRGVVALGCMVEQASRVPAQAAVLRHADACVGFAEYPTLADTCRDLLGRAAKVSTEVSPPVPFQEQPRLLTGLPHHAYLKISEGCSNRCRFCTIPSIRGPQRSRAIEHIVEEARVLIDLGAREISLIGQDTTSYGRDLYGRRCLERLLRAIAGIEADVWFRLMYVYPRFLSDEVLEVLASDARFCPYVDVPLQHISDRMLRAMGRGMGRADTEALLDRIAARLPRAMVRTTFISGYPGETEADHEELLAFLRARRFMHVGVFAYSAEPGTAAARRSDPVPEAEKERRRRELLGVQQVVSRELLAGWVGREIEVVIDGPADPDEDEVPDAGWVGRTAWQAPEIDGVVYVNAEVAAPMAPGSRLHVHVVDALDYDLIARHGCPLVEA